MLMIARRVLSQNSSSPSSRVSRFPLLLFFVVVVVVFSRNQVSENNHADARVVVHVRRRPRSSSSSRSSSSRSHLVNVLTVLAVTYTHARRPVAVSRSTPWGLSASTSSAVGRSGARDRGRISGAIGSVVRDTGGHDDDDDDGNRTTVASETPRV